MREINEKRRRRTYEKIEFIVGKNNWKRMEESDKEKEKKRKNWEKMKMNRRDES